MTIVILRHGLMDEADAALIEQLAVFVLGVDDHKALLVVSEVTLDQRQGALADRTEADQYDGTVDTGMNWPFRHSQSLPRNAGHIRGLSQKEMTQVETRTATTR